MNNYIQEAIERAIKGGWRNSSVNEAYLLFEKIENIGVFINGFNWVILHRKGDMQEEGCLFQLNATSFKPEEVFLDLKFWRALGKSLGWKEATLVMETRLCEAHCSKCGNIKVAMRVNEPEYQQLLFISANNKGERDLFFKNLLQGHVN